MGLNYRYIIAVPEETINRLDDYLNQNLTIQEISDRKCATINFDLDNSITEYLKNSIKQNNFFLFFNKEKHKDYFPGKNTGSLGCIYIDKIESKKYNCVFVSFEAATTRMSILFKESTSINKWFINISKQFGGLISFLDLDNDEYKEIFRDTLINDITYAEILLDYENLLLDF